MVVAAAASVPASAAPAAVPASAPSASARAAPAAPAAEAFSEQLVLLDGMGFKNRDLNKYLLGKCGGDVQRVAMWLCDMNAYKV